MKKLCFIFCSFIVLSIISMNVLINTGECLFDTNLNFTQILATAQSEGGGNSWEEEIITTNGRGFYCDCYPLPGGGNSCIEEICDFTVYESFCFTGGSESCNPDRWIVNNGNCDPTGNDC